jgi:hypothetical protein
VSETALNTLDVEPRSALRFSTLAEIRKMIVAFIRSMVMPKSGVKHIRRQPSWNDQVWEVYERMTGQPRPEMFKTQEQSEKDGHS